MAGKVVEQGWRVVEADGKNTLDAESFVAMNRFKVVTGREAEFEARWQGRTSKLLDFDGFRGFTLGRRDAVRTLFLPGCDFAHLIWIIF